YRDFEQTAASLGIDGPVWRGYFRPFVERFEALRPTLMSSITRIPAAPVLTARFGLHALQSAVGFANHAFQTDEAQGLFAGCAAHSFSALEEPFTASFGLVLAIMGHAVGWPLLKGGSVTLVRALVTLLEKHRGVVRCNHPVRSLAELPA